MRRSRSTDDVAVGTARNATVEPKPPSSGLHR